MTENELKQAEKDAEKDAEMFGLLLLLAMRERRGIAANANVSFDREKGIFIVGGRRVSPITLRMYLQRVQDRSAARIIRLTTELEAGRITYQEWLAAFKRQISSIHILAGALALGGIGTAILSRSTQKRIDEQFYFMGKFGAAMRRDRAGSFAQIKSRAVQYMRAAHITYVNVQLEFFQEFDIYEEAHNRLRPAEHCHRRPNAPPEPIDCPTLTKKGWMPIDEMIPIGQRICRIYCKCFIEYR